MQIEDIRGPVMAIGAHPEDIDIHAGGTVARLIETGQQVIYVVCTSGTRGSNDPTMTPERLRAIREAEQREAAALLGVGQVVFLRHTDVHYESQALREELVRLIRRYRPTTIITHDPYPGDGSHDVCAIYPEHLAVGLGAFEAAFLCAPGRLFYPEHLEEGLEPHRTERLYLIMSQHPDTYVDIGAVWGQKMRAMDAHRSQGRVRTRVEPFFRRIAENLGRKAGCELAEGFRTLKPS